MMRISHSQPVTPPLPDNLTDDDRLLLHLAGELPEADASSAAVLARLAGDESVREFATAFEKIDGLLRVDAARADGRASASAAAAGRFVADAVARDVAPPAVRIRRSWKLPRWTVYPAAAAVLLAVFMSGWWWQVRDEYNKPLVGYVDSTPTLLVLRGDPGGNIDDQNDEQIAAQFDSMFVESRFDPEGRMATQLSTVDYLDASLRRPMR